MKNMAVRMAHTMEATLKNSQEAPALLEKKEGGVEKIIYHALSASPEIITGKSALFKTVPADDDKKNRKKRRKDGRRVHH